MKRQTLIGLVLLLLVQLFLRAHNITRLPVFIDEDNHIVRASTLYDFQQHPAQLSHGKFLLYFLLGVYDLKERDTALYLARTMIALTSLLTSAFVFVVVRRLSKDEDAGLLAVAFYALVPYALFYERMALADPFAGTLGALTLWQSIQLAKKPTRSQAIIVGVCVALTAAAKLTMLFTVGFPVMAFLFLANPRQDALRRFFPLLVIAGIVFTLLWLPVLIPARLSVLDDSKPDFVLVNAPELIEHNGSPLSLLTKIHETWIKFFLLVSLPAAVVLVGMTSFALWDQPRLTGFLLACLLLAWLPSIVLVENLQTRYLMSGIPIVAMILGVAFGTDRAASSMDSLPLAQGLLLVWALLFALPFAYKSMTNPPDVVMPGLDERNYFWDRYNGYGNREAMQYLREHGERFANKVYVFPLTKVCLQLDLYADGDILPICIDEFYNEVLADTEWENPVRELLNLGVPVYVMTSEQQDVPPTAPADITWELVQVFPKPRHIQQVDVWRLRLR